MTEIIKCHCAQSSFRSGSLHCAAHLWVCEIPERAAIVGRQPTPGTGLAARSDEKDPGGILDRIVDFCLVGLPPVRVEAAPESGSRLSRGFTRSHRRVYSRVEGLEQADNLLIRVLRRWLGVSPRVQGPEGTW